MADKETDISWALKLLTSDPEKEDSVLGGCATSIMGAGAGLMTAVFINYASRRPIWSGIQKHLAFPIIGASIGRWWDNSTAKTLAERDAVFRHYITLHPEDFPPPDRKKFGEILMPWIPVR